MQPEAVRSFHDRTTGAARSGQAWRAVRRPRSTRPSVRWRATFPTARCRRSTSRRARFRRRRRASSRSATSPGRSSSSALPLRRRATKISARMLILPSMMQTAFRRAVRRPCCRTASGRRRRSTARQRAVHASSLRQRGHGVDPSPRCGRSRCSRRQCPTSRSAARLDRRLPNAGGRRLCHRCDHAGRPLPASSARWPPARLPTAPSTRAVEAIDERDGRRRAARRAHVSRQCDIAPSSCRAPSSPQVRRERRPRPRLPEPARRRRAGVRAFRAGVARGAGLHRALRGAAVGRLVAPSRVVRLARCSAFRWPIATFVRSRRCIRARSSASTCPRSTRSSARRRRGRRACGSARRDPRLLHQYRQPLRVRLRGRTSARCRRASLPSPGPSSSASPPGTGAPRRGRRRWSPTRITSRPGSSAITAAIVDVLPCPVDVDRFTVGAGGGDYFVVVARLLPYKRIDLAIAAAPLAGVPLLVVGTGPAEAELRELARGTTTTLLRYVERRDARRADRPRARRHRRRRKKTSASCRSRPRRRAARRSPIGRGGALETVVDGETGEFFADQSRNRSRRRCAAFDETRFDPQRLRAHAEQFAPPRFVARLRDIVAEVRAS